MGAEGPDRNGRFHDEHGQYVSLKEFILRILDERQAADHARLEAEIRMSRLERIDMERRLEGLNELRKQVVDDRGQFVTKDSWQAQHKILEEDIGELEQWRAVHRELGAHPYALKVLDQIDARLKPLETFRGRAVIIAAGLMALSGVIGAAIVKALGG